MARRMRKSGKSSSGTGIFGKAVTIVLVLIVIIIAVFSFAPGGERVLSFGSPAGQFTLPAEDLNRASAEDISHLASSRFQRISDRQCFVNIPLMYPGQSGAYELNENNNWFSFEAGVLEGEVGARIEGCTQGTHTITVAYSFSGENDIRLAKMRLN